MRSRVAAVLGLLLVVATPGPPARASAPPVVAPLAAAYARLGGVDGVLGPPQAAAVAVAGGVTQTFTRGDLSWSSATGAHEVHGALATRYRQLGGPAGRLGFPVHDVRRILGGRQAELQHGALRWDAVSGVRTLPVQAPVCTSPFTAAVRADLRARFPDQRVTAAVYDTASRCWYDLARDLQITTASVVKAQVLGAVLLHAQDARRSLTDWERRQVDPMVRYSFNQPYVGNLYDVVGGVAGMDAFDRRVGATATTNTLRYGATWTTARDRTLIARAMLYGLGPLGPTARAQAWASLARVHPTQQWGVTAGVPAGWAVALKNGFYPMPGYGWRVGSTGFVRRPGSTGGYAVTVLTDHNTSQRAGMRLVDAVSRLVAGHLAGGPPARRAVDASHCTTVRSGESWPTVTARLRVSAALWPRVRTVSGGNPVPLTGQRACAPTVFP